MDIFTIAVGVSMVRPIVPDQETVFVTLAAASLQDAMRTAAQIAATRSEMPTSTTLVSVVI